MKTTILLFVAALGVAASGCTVRTVGTARPAAATIETTYEPVYHDGYVVYYDDAGAPYYYDNDRVTYVPRTHASFNVYVGHYRTHQHSYRRWHRTEGPRYRTVRRQRPLPPPRSHRPGRH